MSDQQHKIIEDQRTIFKYVLRLLELSEAQQLEFHINECLICENQLKDVIHFCDLLRKSMHISKETTRPVKGSAKDISKEEADDQNSAKPEEEERSILAEHNEAQWANLLGSANQPGRLIEVFANCYSGFHKLRKNISIRMSPTLSDDQIDLAAIEILLALPSQVSSLRKDL